MFAYFLRREINNRYIGNSSVVFWIFFQPLLTLLIYNFVFSYIFKARIPDMLDGTFIAYLAIGLWPWMAFSESVIRSISCVTERKDLLGKVKIDLRVIVLANITATFILHFIGYVFVIILLIAFGKISAEFNLLLLLIPLTILYLLAIMFGLFFSALQVFYKDLQQIMSTLMTLWFFSTPIIYAISAIPVKYHAIMSWNPLFGLINFIHNIVFKFSDLDWMSLLKLLTVILILMFIGNIYFKKLAPQFDDFV